MMCEEMTLYFRIWVISLLVVIFIAQINHHNDMINSLRTMGVQCVADYTINIPKGDL